MTGCNNASRCSQRANRRLVLLGNARHLLLASRQTPLRIAMMPPPQLLGLPYDASSSFLRGAAEAPPVIRAALRSSAGNSWSEALIDLWAPGGLIDGGDLVLSEGTDVRAELESGVVRVLTDGFRPVLLGGDHSVTYPAMRAINMRYPRPTIVHIDAHSDLYDEFEGDRYSHACPFARILEETLAAHLIQIGIRAMNGHQRQQADRYGVDVIDMRRWTEGARPVVDGPIYLSIDLDGIDPAHAPGVSHKEPGGLTVREVLTIVQSLGGTIVGADIVELNPRQDIAGVTAIVAAKLVKEVASRMLQDR